MAIIAIGNKEFTLDEVYEISLPTSYITNEGQNDINRFLRSTPLKTKTGDRFYDMDWVHGEKIDYVWKTERGTFPKRLGKYLYDQHKIILSEDQLAEIGNIARSHSIDVETLYMDFTRTFTWDDGAFGDADSCFWGSHSHARDILYENNAHAIRFYKDKAGERGYARCWVADIPEGWIFFNGYGLSVLKISQLVSAICGLFYRKVELTVNGDTTGMVWIGARSSENKGSGYVIGDMLEVRDLSTYNLAWDESVRYTCSHCHNRVNDVYHDSNSNPICIPCYQELYFVCDRCNRNHLIAEQIEDVNGNHICEACFHNYYRECNHCHRAVRSRYAINYNAQIVCSHCYETLVQEYEHENNPGVAF